MRSRYVLPLLAAGVLVVGGCSDDGATAPSVQESRLLHLLPDHNTLRAQLRAVLEEQNGGLGFEMWPPSWTATAKLSTWCSAVNNGATNGPAVASYRRKRPTLPMLSAWMAS